MTSPVPVTPRPAATVMLLRDADRPDGTTLEVLLLRRSTDTPFVPGAQVFPGGAVEGHDDDPAYDELCDMTDADASDRLGVPTGGRAYWVAAARECIEEAGVLLACDGDDLVDDAHPVMSGEDELRNALERDELSLGDVCRTHGLDLPLASMVYVSQWITPEESPRRYDTRFFAAAMPPGQSASADDWEAVEARWWAPTDALAAWQAGDIQMIEPTVASLGLLSDHDSVTAALAALSRGSAHGR